MIEDMPRRRIQDITSELIESIYMSRELSSALSDFFGSKTVCELVLFMLLQLLVNAGRT